MKKFKSKNTYKKYHVLVLNKENEFDETKIISNLMLVSFISGFTHLKEMVMSIGNLFSELFFQIYSLYKEIRYKIAFFLFTRMGNKETSSRKKILLLLATGLTSNITLANNIESSKLPVTSDLNMTLRAYSAFESSFSKQNNLNKSEKNVSSNKEGFAFYNDTALFASISNKINEIEYGGKIILVPTSKRKSNPAYNGSHIFVKSSFGTIELGSPVPAAKNMMISDGSIPGKYIKKSTDYLKQNKFYSPAFLTSNKHFLGDDIVASLDNVKYSNEPPRTINYYTPSMKVGTNTKVQLGISYTPDSSNTGAGELVEKSKVDKKKIEEADLHRFEIDRSVTDAVTAGINLEQRFSNNIKLKVALTGEYGKTAGKAKKFAKKDDKNPIHYKLANLRTYNIGSELKINDFTFNACYGDLGKSFTTPEFHRSGTKSHYYNAGVAYKYNATTTKLSYFGSNQYKNKVSMVKLNVSHLLAPGLKPYVELSSYTLKGKPEFDCKLKSRTTKGTVALIGMKLTL